MARESAALRVVKEQPEPEEAPKGDPTLTKEAMGSWNAGQKRCRGRKRHNWNPFTVYEHGKWYDVVEQCGHCKNRRSADFVVTQRGLRQATKWKPDYRGGYLLPKGAARIDVDLQDELTASDILSRRIVEVTDDDEDEEA